MTKVDRTFCVSTARPLNKITPKDIDNEYYWGLCEGLSTVRHLIMPYYIEAVDQPKKIYSIQNRNYQAIYSDENGEEILFRADKMSDKIAAGISFNDEGGRSAMFLYNDGCIPFSHDKEATEDYLKRYSKLSQWMQVKKVSI